MPPSQTDKERPKNSDETQDDNSFSVIPKIELNSLTLDEESVTTTLVRMAGRAIDLKTSLSNKISQGTMRVCI